MEYLPTFALKKNSFVGKYTSTMEHMGYSKLVGGFKHCLFSISYMGCHPPH